MKKIRYYTDRAELIENTVHITGWAIALKESAVKVSVIARTHSSGQLINPDGTPSDLSVRVLSRPDASLAVLGNESQADCGFDIRFTCDMAVKYRVIFRTDSGQARYDVAPASLARESTKRLIPLRRRIRMTTPAMLGDDLRFLLKKGPGALAERWERRYETDENKYFRYLKKQRETEYPGARSLCEAARRAVNAPGPGTVSIVVPLYNTPVKYYRQMLDSVLAQTYPDWQLCLADGSDDGTDRSSCLPSDKRIVYRRLSRNQGISGNSNEALSMAEGEWIALLDHDDVLEADALAQMLAKAKETGADMIYSDEDKVSPDLKIYSEPHFKSDYNPDLLRSNNYICHFLMFRRQLFTQVGGFSKEYDGAQDYDLILRLTEKAEVISHIPRVLYHWRIQPSSTAGNPESKAYADEAGRRALEAHLRRIGISGTVEKTERPGYYRVRYRVCDDGEDGSGIRPVISIIIANKDQADTLRTCITSITEKTDWPDYEIIVVENNSTTDEIRDYYRQLEKDPRARVITWSGEFNYSAVNNFGVSHSVGDYVILLNNDTEIITGDWLDEMAGICSRPDVGVVGARLFYRDGTVQHAGVVMKLAGCCGHVFYGAQGTDPGAYARAQLIQDYSAVTGACMMCRREVWDRLGGLSTDFRIAYNDVDFCLRARKLGLLVVFTPYAQAWHDESKTRGYEEGSEKIERFTAEQQLLRERWPEYMTDGDPYYNPNLTLSRPDFSGLYLHEDEQ